MKKILFISLVLLSVVIETEAQRRQLKWSNVMLPGTANTFAGWNATGDAAELTGTQVTTLLSTFNSTTKGLVPASGGGTANFLRADGTWASVSSGITNTAAVNELMKSNGTNAIPSGLFSSVDGDLLMGSDASTTRTITAGSSGLNSSLWLKAKGTGTSTLWDANLANFLSVGPTEVTGRSTSHFYFESSTALTNTVTPVLSLAHNTSGVHAAGIGTSIRLGTETSASNIEYGGLIESVSTDVTPLSEDFDLAFKTMSAGATATEKLRLTSDGRLYGTALHNNAGAITGTTNQYIASGTYTPTLTGSLNISSTTSAVCFYTRVGNCVSVSGVVQATPTAGGNADTTFTMSLPIASDFTLQGDAGGSAGAYNFNLSTAIVASSATDNVSFRFLSPGTTVINFAFHFMYLIK